MVAAAKVKKERVRYRTKTWGERITSFLVPKGKEHFSISFLPAYESNIVVPDYAVLDFDVDAKLPDYIEGEWAGKTYLEWLEGQPDVQKGNVYEDKAFRKEHYRNLVTNDVKAKKEELEKLEALVSSVAPQVAQMEQEKEELAKELAKMRAEFKALQLNAPKSKGKSISKGESQDVS